jgi:hypothetical protein
MKQQTSVYIFSAYETFGSIYFAFTTPITLPSLSNSGQPLLPGKTCAGAA